MYTQKMPKRCQDVINQSRTNKQSSETMILVVMNAILAIALRNVQNKNIKATHH